MVCHEPVEASFSHLGDVVNFGGGKRGADEFIRVPFKDPLGKFQPICYDE